MEEDWNDQDKEFMLEALREVPHAWQIDINSVYVSLSTTLLD